MARNLVVGQSGGPTAVINGSLYGVISEGIKSKDAIGKVYGMVNGIQGFLQDHVMDIEAELSPEKIELIKTTPGAFLGSCRFKLPEDLADPVYDQIFEQFKKYDIGYFFYIGGNDSMDTVSKLSRKAEELNYDICVLGEPKTIDNDLIKTDHTPGFGSAAKYVATTVREVTLDANVYESKSVTIVEIMGRHAGWLAAASVLARKYENDNPLLIYLPEVAFDEEKFLKQVEAAFEKNPNVVVCISEGINDGNGKFVCENASDVGVDNFGHKMLTGSGKYLENLVKARLGVKVRSIELNVCQRCSSAMLSKTDQEEAIAAGRFGVQAGIKGETGKMIAFQRTSNAPYTIEHSLEDVNEICNMEKTVPVEWITGDGSDIAQEFIDYALPLIQGDVEIPMENGMPAFAYRK